MTSVNSGSGVVRVCDSAVAGGAVVAVGPGVGGTVAAAVVAAAVAVAVGVDAGAAVAGAAAGAVGGADAVDVGGGAAGAARAGEIVTAVSEARVTTNAVNSAVVFRIEFTCCLS